MNRLNRLAHFEFPLNSNKGGKAVSTSYCKLNFRNDARVRRLFTGKRCREVCKRLRAKQASRLTYSLVILMQ